MAHELLFIYTVPLYNHSNDATLLSLHVVALMGLLQNCDIPYSGFCHEDFNVASQGIRDIKIRYIFYLVTLSREIL